MQVFRETIYFIFLIKNYFISLLKLYIIYIYVIFAVLYLNLISSILATSCAYCTYKRFYSADREGSVRDMEFEA